MKKYLVAVIAILLGLGQVADATLVCGNPVKIASQGTANYGTIKDAYAAAGSWAELQISGMDYYQENVAINTKGIILTGGWDCNQTSHAFPRSEITGTFTVSGAGAAIIDGIAIGPATSPTGLTATKGTAPCLKINLNWTAKPGTSTYGVYELYNGGLDWVTDISTPYYTVDATIKAGLALTYRVTAYDGTAETPLSAPSIGWAQAVIPTSVYATRGTYPNQVVISWDTMTCVQEYYVYWSYNSNFSPYYQVIGNPVTPNTNHSFTHPVGAGTTIYYKVTSVYRGLDNQLYETLLNLSPVVTGWTAAQAPQYLPAPTGLWATDGTLYHAVNLGWNSVAGATGGYNLYRSDSTFGPWTKILSNYSGTTYQDTNLFYWSGYWYKVSAVGATGEGYVSPYEAGCAGSLVLFP